MHSAAQLKDNADAAIYDLQFKPEREQEFPQERTQDPSFASRAVQYRELRMAAIPVIKTRSRRAHTGSPLREGSGTCP